MSPKKYQVTFTVTTNSDPADIVSFIERRIKDALPVMGIQYQLLEDRPTDIEHHGGYDIPIPMRY
tara:strand:- start:38 stop:232 length:195 start_codon:yes stop_codon:yes gene_type:complete